MLPHDPDGSAADRQPGDSDVAPITSDGPAPTGLVDTPILTGAIGEQAGELFATDYFDLGKAYLAQTGQLYVEAAAAALGKVY